MPEDTTDATPPNTPQPADPVEKLLEEPPPNYDGLPPPGLPSPPGQDAPPA